MTSKWVLNPLHLSHACFEGMDPLTLIDKPFHIGVHSFRVNSVKVKPTEVIVGLGEEITR